MPVLIVREEGVFALDMLCRKNRRCLVVFLIVLFARTVAAAAIPKHASDGSAPLLGRCGCLRPGVELRHFAPVLRTGCFVVGHTRDGGVGVHSGGRGLRGLCLSLSLGVGLSGLRGVGLGAALCGVGMHMFAQSCLDKLKCGADLMN